VTVVVAVDGDATLRLPLSDQTRQLFYAARVGSPVYGRSVSPGLMYAAAAVAEAVPSDVFAPVPAAIVPTGAAWPVVHAAVLIAAAFRDFSSNWDHWNCDPAGIGSPGARNAAVAVAAAEVVVAAVAAE